MTKYLYTFPGRAMELGEGGLDQAAAESHDVVQQAKDAGVWVFGGGLDDGVAAVRVAADGTLLDGSYPETEHLTGGFAVLEVPSRESALEWGARLAAACRCPQEVREFMYDPES